MQTERQTDIYYVSFPKEEKSKVKKALSFVFGPVESLCGAFVIIFLIFAFCLRAVGVSGNSMFDTLSDGDRVAVKSINLSYERLQIVVVAQPWEKNIPIIKRIIGLPGDEIKIVNDKDGNGSVYVNGELLNEDYIYEPMEGGVPNETLTVTVPEDHYFVMGDNRNNSLDSRSTKVGLIREDYILGEAAFRFYPQFKSLVKENKVETL